MRIPRIYTPQELHSNAEIALEAAASHHLIKVLRMAQGRPLVLFNGDGHQYDASIVRIEKKTAIIKTTSSLLQANDSPLTSELAIALSKGDRMDWVLQKATELGVSRIVPLFSERSEVKLSGERLQKKQTSWQQIIISACEQCQRNVLPQLASAQTLESYIEQCSSELKLVLHHRSDKTLSNYTSVKSVSLLIGPEGGLSDTEIAMAQEHGFSPLTLGKRVLRTETAPLAALSIMQYLWGDLESMG
ncbi:16S rRNA (uracil(1498)-N(3))-methyltransferase [Agarilytica rhodophyticola]|uniref:16S rRNA (uracil(1498)-N(3))-methyltransferase n=1 Tax=Agarilytica rhodophyticola TaxID=1737490 RepID=UPI000B34771D|nr:16S rRNA (uracil(1498)-N(3))-methyltransferase [Agarilytica rhodophyticola]